MVSTSPMRDENMMIQVIALDSDLVDKLKDIVIDYRDDVEGGGVITSQPRSDELHDLDAILAALRGAETPTARVQAVTNWPNPDARPVY
jgi:acyl-ACP thioesterase